MLEWMSANLATICISIVLIALIFAIVHILYKDKKNGKNSCGCNCAHCAMAGSCHKK